MSRRILLITILALAFSGYAAARASTPTPQPLQATSYKLSANSWTMTVVGDIMLDRYVRSKINVQGKTYPFAKITNQLKGADVVLGNLEGPFTQNKSVATNNHLIFTFDPAMAPILKQVGFTTFSLANNHTLNFGQAGLNSTRAILQKSNLDYFGDPRNVINTHLTKIINGQPVTFLGYDGLDGNLAPVLLDVQRAHQKGEYVIVMPHSGTEYNLNFTARQQQDYRQLIDAGADLILGSHPHVVEPLEIYKSKLIVYSLGNFVFDQYFSADTQQGLMLKLSFSEKNISVNIIPLVETKSQVSVASGNIKTKLLQRLANTSVVSSNIKSGILQGTFTITK